ncbi:MAG TPA: ABC transporter permease [Candidatus Pacearchaeota archaeon]|nr:ABC transporter permease [Candidatus Pacearchaeota archaeon]
MNSLKIAYDNLKRNKTRMILTMIAIALGVSILIIMMAAGAGLKKMILGEIDYYGSDVINIETRVPGKNGTDSSTDMAKGVVVTTLKNKNVEKLKKHENVEFIYSYVTGQEVIKHEGENKNTLIFGYGADAPKVEKLELEEGRFYTEEEEVAAESVIVLGYDLKQDLFGENDAISEIVYVKNMPFRVVGVVEKRGGGSFMNMDSIAYIPTITMQKKILGTDYVLGLSLKVKDVSRLDETKEDLMYILREEHDIENPEKEDDFEIATMVEMIEMVSNIINGVNAFLIVLALISLVVGGIGIMNIMYVSVTERIFEIGLRMAVGANKNHILKQFLFEALLLTLIGGIAGVILGISVCLFFNYIASILNIGISTIISPSSIIFSLLFATFLGLLSGIYPAKKASNLDPIVALKK